MATITDFREWLSQVFLEGYEDVYTLYNCVKMEEDWGDFTCQKDDKGTENIFIKSSSAEDTLMLASNKANFFFYPYFAKRIL